MSNEMSALTPEDVTKVHEVAMGLRLLGVAMSHGPDGLIFRPELTDENADVRDWLRARPVEFALMAQAAVEKELLAKARQAARLLEVIKALRAKTLTPAARAAAQVEVWQLARNIGWVWALFLVSNPLAPPATSPPSSLDNLRDFLGDQGVHL